MIASKIYSDVFQLGHKIFIMHSSVAKLASFCDSCMCLSANASQHGKDHTAANVVYDVNSCSALQMNGNGSGFVTIRIKPDSQGRFGFNVKVCCGSVSFWFSYDTL